MYYTGLNPFNLNDELINRTYEELEKGAATGYGKKWKKFNSTNSDTVKKIQQNLYVFSSAKTYQQLEEMNSFLVDEKGKIRTYSEFKRKVDVVNKKYNRNYLQAEYQTSKRSAQATRQWETYQKDAGLFPNLKYMTVEDNKVREDHVNLNTIIKPINDPFWDTHYPPNGFRCRCYVKQTTEKTTTKKITTNPDKGFANNVGKTKEVFNTEHPYFTMPKEAKKSVEEQLKKFKKAQEKKKDGENK